MSKHTPGPWEWDGDYLQEVDGREGGVLEPFATNSCDGVIDCTDADRALIRAAPELYEALETIANHPWTEYSNRGDHPYSTGVTDGHRAAANIARAALAKARGEVVGS